MGYYEKPNISQVDVQIAQGRESSRFLDGTYQRLPWELPHKPELTNHFAHRSRDCPDMIAFTVSIEKLIADKQTRIKPGRYLKQFYGDVFDDQQITEMVSVYLGGKDLSLRFIPPCPEDADSGTIRGLRRKWIDVYSVANLFGDGSSYQSCMTGKDIVKVYVHPGNGIGLCYAVTPTDLVVGRAIVTDSNEFVRVYAIDEYTRQSIESMLKDLGYHRSYHLLGRRLARMTDEDGDLICPYLDHNSDQDEGDEENGIDDMNSYLLIVRVGDADYVADNTDGSLDRRSRDEDDDEDEEYECTQCDYTTDDYYDLNGTYDEGRVCDRCLNRDFVNAFVGSGRFREYVLRGDATYCSSNDEWYHDDILSDCGIIQLYDDRWFEEDEAVCVGGEYYPTSECLELDIPNAVWVVRSEAIESSFDNWIRKSESISVNGWVFHLDEVLEDPDNLAAILHDTSQLALLDAMPDLLKRSQLITAIQSLEVPA